MLSTDRSLVRAQYPAFDQGGNAMNTGHADVGRIAGVRKNNPVVSIPALRQLVIPSPSIGQDLGACFCHFTHERHKAGTGHVGYLAYSHPSEPLRRTHFHRNHHNLLLFAASPAFARLSISPLKYSERLPWLSHAAFFA